MLCVFVGPFFRCGLLLSGDGWVVLSRKGESRVIDPIVCVVLVWGSEGGSGIHGRHASYIFEGPLGWSGLSCFVVFCLR